MTRWKKLPNELKFEIIKNMDFLTRFRFRHTAASSLILVDAILFKIPRIYLSFVDPSHFCLLVFESTSCVIEFEFSTEDTEDCDCTIMIYNPSTVTEAELIGVYYDSNDKRSKKLLPEPIKNFFYALKTITGGRRTLGGIDIFGVPLWNHDVDVMALLEGCQIRARIVTFDDDWVALPILMKCSNVMEIHNPRTEKEILFTGNKGQDEARVINSKVSWMKFNSTQKCSHYTVVCRYQDNDVEELCEAMYKRLTPSEPNQYALTYYGALKYKLKLFDTPCGFVNQKMPLEYVEVEPQKCPRHRACETHSDPFEYWYFNEKRTFYVGNRVVKHKAWNKYENVQPVVNGVCPVQEFMDGRDKLMKEWTEKRKRLKYRWERRSKVVRYARQRREGRLDTVISWIVKVWKLVSGLTLLIVLVYLLGRYGECDMSWFHMVFHVD